MTVFWAILFLASWPSRITRWITTRVALMFLLALPALMGFPIGLYASAFLDDGWPF